MCLSSCYFLVLFSVCAKLRTIYAIMNGWSVSCYIKFEIAKLLFVLSKNAIFAVPENCSSLRVDREILNLVLLELNFFFLL